MHKPAAIIAEFVMERLEGETIARRILLNRALSALTVDIQEQKSLNQMADELEAIQRKHQQLLLDFKRRAQG